MNPRRHPIASVRWLTGLFSLLVLSAPALADVGPDIEVRLIVLDSNTVPERGELVRATLELMSSTQMVVTGVDVDSGRGESGVPHWEPVLIDVPTDVLLEPGIPQDFSVELIANYPLEPVDIVMEAGSRTLKHRFFVVAPVDLGAGFLPPSMPVDGTPELLQSIPLGEDPPIDLWTAPDPFQLPAGAKMPGVDGLPGDDVSDAHLAKGPTINIKGRLVVPRPGDTTVGVDGASVLVFDSDPGPDQILGGGVTSADGSFDFDVIRGNEAAPDIFIIFYSANAVLNVQYSWALASTGSYVSTWSSQLPVYMNHTGNVLDVGTREPSPNARPAFYMTSIITKTWRFLSGLGHTPFLDRVRVSWPDATATPFYRRSSKTIFMNTARQWREDTMIHEFGHHWLTTYGNSPPPEYCNSGGFADPPFSDCGHNVWCNENSSVAWTEGLPNFLADMVINFIEDNYHSSMNQRNTETIQMCGANSAFGDPNRTENILAALLRDVSDNVNDNDPAFGSTGVDQLTMGVGEVLSLARHPLTPFSPDGFHTVFMLQNPGKLSSYWFTAMNNGYDVDQLSPPPPTGLTSPSHVPFVESPNEDIQLSWIEPNDDISGVRRYIVELASTPVYPSGAGSFLVVGNSVTVADLAPDSYFVSVIAEDWSGKTSGNYTNIGPLMIREPEPPDFAVESGPSWPYPLVPRKTDDTTVNYAPLPLFLYGDQPQTWLNYRVENQGELSNPVTVYNRYYVDGVLLGTNSIPTSWPLVGGASRIFYNQGPFAIRGGRHRLVVHTDVTGLMPEPDELNNYHGQQFIWAPTVLVSNFADRAAPPDPYGGFISPHPFTSVNCDGLAYPGTTAPFTGLAIVPDEPQEDPDLRSHLHTTGPTDGFNILGVLANSSRPAGAVDAVFTNTNSDPGLVVDAGIYSFFGMIHGYRAWPLASTTIPTSTEVPITIASGEYISLHDFLIPGLWGTIYGTIHVSIPADSGPLWVALIPPDVDHFGLDDATVVGKTGRGGTVSLDFTYAQPLHGLVLYRDREHDGSEPRALTATVWVGPTPPNFVAAEGLPGWAAPVVPTNGAPGNPGSVPAPATLVGESSSTYLNTAIANDGPNPAVPLEHFTMIDGTNGPGQQSSGIVAGGTHTKNFSSPVVVRGGRHTLWMRIDANDLVSESDEEDNIWGQQWVWEPPTLSPGLAPDFPAPGNPIGGLDAFALAQNTAFYLNCMGLRDDAPVTSGNDGHWRAVAVMPGPASDVDARLHEVEPGVYNGFKDALISSNWGTGQSDYVLTNFRATGARPMDVGVVAVQGNEAFQAQTVESTFLDTHPVGSYGDFTMGDRELIALHEVELMAGLLTTHLISLTGSVDWGITLHRANLPHQSKLLGQASPSAWAAPAGSNELLITEVPEDGYYCLAVWKATSADVALAGDYRLLFTPHGTDTGPAERVVASGLRSIHPNPFNPRTVVDFELARAGRVELQVYDVRGALVRTLLSEVRSAGRHEVSWNGLDDRGRHVASGVYYVALNATGLQDVRKAVLVK